MLYFAVFLTAFIASLLGSITGTYLFILYLKLFKPTFYNQLKRNKAQQVAPIQDRKNVESSTPTTEPSKDSFESLMSAVATSQGTGGDILYADNQTNYGWDKTIDDLCKENDFVSHISRETPEDDVYKALEDEKEQIPEEVPEQDAEINSEKTYPDNVQADDTKKMASSKPDIAVPETKVSPTLIMDISPDAVQRRPQQKRKRGRPPKNKSEKSE